MATYTSLLKHIYFVNFSHLKSVVSSIVTCVEMTGVCSITLDSISMLEFCGYIAEAELARLTITYASRTHNTLSQQQQKNRAKTIKLQTYSHTRFEPEYIRRKTQEHQDEVTHTTQFARYNYNSDDV